MDDNMSLTLVFTGDKIDPGRHFFARIDNAKPATSNSWWLVMVVTPDLMPQKMLDEKEKAMRKVNFKDVYPCWLMGLGRFLWIPPNRLYYPHENQVEKFRRPEVRETFRKYYELTEGEAASPTVALQYFSLPVLKDCELVDAKHLASTPSKSSSPAPAPPYRSESGMFFSEAGSPEPNHDIEDDDNRGRRKRPREEVTSLPGPMSPALRGLFTPSPSDETADQPVYIKTEDEEQTFADINGLSKNDLVTIYVGANSHEHKIPSADLAKSPVLMSWLKTDSEKPYVMHPNLTSVDNQHFASLIRFMHNGEYLPKLVGIPVSMNNTSGTPVLRKGLEKLRTSDQYSMQLIRAGHLYKLAELFLVEGFKKYIYQRITEAEFCTYNNSAVLDLASLIFSRPKGTAQASTDSTEELEEWILTKIAWEYQTIMKKHSSLFFKVAAKTGKSKFFQRLLRRKAELVDEAGGEPEQLD